MGAAIAWWIRRHLQACCPRFESQAHHLRFFSIYIEYLSFELECEKTKINKKRPGLAHFFKKNMEEQQ